MRRIECAFFFWCITIPQMHAATVHRHARSGSTSKMRQLLCNHPDEVTHFSMSGKQPLHIATIWGNTEMVHLLLSLGAPVDGRTRNSKRTPLFYAAKSRNFIISSELLKAGANPHAQDIFQKTPIHMAQRTKRIHGGEMLKLLERYSQ